MRNLEEYNIYIFLKLTNRPFNSHTSPIYVNVQQEQLINDDVYLCHFLLD